MSDQGADQVQELPPLPQRARGDHPEARRRRGRRGVRETRALCAGAGHSLGNRQLVTGIGNNQGGKKEQVRQCYGFCTADFWS